MDILKKLTEEFPSIREDRAQNIINLIDEGNTIPFIARYRKEMTGSCCASLTTACCTCATSKRGRKKSQNPLQIRGK